MVDNKSSYDELCTSPRKPDPRQKNATPPKNGVHKQATIGEWTLAVCKSVFDFKNPDIADSTSTMPKIWSFVAVQKIKSESDDVDPYQIGVLLEDARTHRKQFFPRSELPNSPQSDGFSKALFEVQHALDHDPAMSYDKIPDYRKEEPAPPAQPAPAVASKGKLLKQVALTPRR